MSQCWWWWWRCWWLWLWLFCWKRKSIDIWEQTKRTHDCYHCITWRKGQTCWYGSSKTMMSCCMVVQTCSSPRTGQQVTGLHLEKSCVCAPCMWWSNLGWFDLFGCVHTSTKRILAVSQFRNVHVIFPIGIWNGHKAFYLLWRASKSSATELGPLVCTSRYVSGLWSIWLCCPLFCLWLLSGSVSRTNSIQFTCTNRCLTSWTECRTNWRSAQALLVIIIICCFEDIIVTSLQHHPWLFSSCASKGSSSFVAWRMMQGYIMWMPRRTMLLGLKSCEHHSVEPLTKWTFMCVHWRLRDVCNVLRVRKFKVILLQLPPGFAEACVQFRTPGGFNVMWPPVVLIVGYAAGSGPNRQKGWVPWLDWSSKRTCHAFLVMCLFWLVKSWSMFKSSCTSVGKC